MYMYVCVYINEWMNEWILHIEEDIQTNVQTKHPIPPLPPYNSLFGKIAIILYVYLGHFFSPVSIMS